MASFSLWCQIYHLSESKVPQVFHWVVRPRLSSKKEVVFLERFILRISYILMRSIYRRMSWYEKSLSFYFFALSLNCWTWTTLWLNKRRFRVNWNVPSIYFCSFTFNHNGIWNPFLRALKWRSNIKSFPREYGFWKSISESGDTSK